MKTLLEKAKTLLIAQANDLYDIRKDDLDLDALSFRNHYSNLGELVFQIECYQSFGDIIKDLENDNLQIPNIPIFEDYHLLGYWGADEDMIDEFLKAVMKNN